MKLLKLSLKSKFLSVVLRPSEATMVKLMGFIKSTSLWLWTTLESLGKQLALKLSSFQKLLKKYVARFSRTMRDILNRLDIQ